MMIGMHANRVNRPIMTNSAQKNSAKITSMSEAVNPIPMKLIISFFFSAKPTSLMYPWCIMSIPKKIRRLSIAKLKAPAE